MSIYKKMLELFGEAKPWVPTEEEQKRAEKFNEEYRRKRTISDDTLYCAKNNLSKYVPNSLNNSRPYGSLF